MEVDIWEQNDTGHQEAELKTAKNRVGERLAKFFSLLLHPFLMPFFGVLCLLYGQAYIRILPARFKLYILGIFALTTFIFPAFTIGLLKSLQVIPDFSLNKRRERVLPILIVAAGFGVCYFLLSNYIALGLLSQLLIGAFFVVLICFSINLFWKISLHMAAIGGLLGMLFYVTFRGYGQLTSLFLIFVLFAGTLGVARLYLGRHNVLQILLGILVGAGVMYLSLSLL